MRDGGREKEQRPLCLAYGTPLTRAGFALAHSSRFFADALSFLSPVEPEVYFDA